MRLLHGSWTVQIIWYLRGGARRFGELRFDMPKLSAKTLSARLLRLGRDGIVTREVKPTSPPTVEYALTPLGERLLPAIEGIIEVGRAIKLAKAARGPARPPRDSSRHAAAARFPG